MSCPRQSGAGSAVVANGLEATREGRLLSWADEIAVLVATQRDDLRRSRMELVAAQEVRRSLCHNPKPSTSRLPLASTMRHHVAVCPSSSAARLSGRLHPSVTLVPV